LSFSPEWRAAIDTADDPHVLPSTSDDDQIILGHALAHETDCFCGLDLNSLGQQLAAPPKGSYGYLLSLSRKKSQKEATGEAKPDDPPSAMEKALTQHISPPSKEFGLDRGVLATTSISPL
jgi:hypothetical protein